MSMRPYQEDCINQIARCYSRGIKKVLLKLPTGGGKTHIFADIMKRTAEKGNECLMAVRGRQLVEQASQRLFHEKVQHGVRMAAHWNKNYQAKIQICSIDTLTTRQDYPPAKLVVIDEAHLFQSEKCIQFLSHYHDAYILAVTATPYTQNSLRHLADEIVNPISMQELIDQGYLVRPRYFAPSTPDMKGVHTRQGDYVNSEIEERMNVLTGDIVSHWKSLGQDRPTLCFAVNIKHSKSIVDQFMASGIPAEHIEGDNTFDERKAAIDRLRSGQIKILSNVGVLCTGVDIPFASAILLARPTKSYNLYIQQCGRGTRICPEVQKNDFIILDHAGNVLRHGFITDEPEIDLDGVERKEKSGPQPKVCQKCFAIFTGKFCHVCGFEVPKCDTLEVELEPGMLRELVNFPKGMEISLFIARCKETQKRKGYNYWWSYYKVKDKYGQDAADKAFPGKKRQEAGRSNMPWFLRTTFKNGK